MRNLLRTEPFAAERALPEISWPERIEKAASAVFRDFLSPRIATVSSLSGRYGDLTAIVGLSGAISGTLSLNCSSGAARNFAIRMLGIPKPSEEQAHISLGELAHRIARKMGKEATGPAGECRITAPVVVGDANAECDPLAESYLVAFEYLNFPVWVRFSIYSMR